jgi:hypothetical protein
MNHLKKFEGFFTKKRPFEDQEIADKIKDSLVELSDLEYNTDVSTQSSTNLFNDPNPTIIIKIWKNRSDFKVIEIKKELEFIISYASEFGLKLQCLSFRESKMTHKKDRFTGMQSGTRRTINYTRLSKIKADDETSSIEIRLI